MTSFLWVMTAWALDLPSGFAAATDVLETRTALAAPDGEVVIWHHAQRRRLLTLQGPAAPESLSWSSEILAASGQGLVRAWSLQAGVLLGEWPGVGPVAVSPNGGLVATGEALYAFGHAEPVQTWEPCDALVWSENALLLACQAGEEVRGIPVRVRADPPQLPVVSVRRRR
jgi:hypothetical protein